MTTTPVDEQIVAPPGPLPLALMASGVRCLLVYVVLPGLAPLVGAFVYLALPVVLVLYALGLGLSVRAFRRAWAEERYGVAGLAAMLGLLNAASLLVTLA